MKYRLYPSPNDFEGFQIIDDETGKVVAVTVTADVVEISPAESEFADWLVKAMNKSHFDAGGSL